MFQICVPSPYLSCDDLYRGGKHGDRKVNFGRSHACKLFLSICFVMENMLVIINFVYIPIVRKMAPPT